MFDYSRIIEQSNERITEKLRKNGSEVIVLKKVLSYSFGIFVVPFFILAGDLPAQISSLIHTTDEVQQEKLIAQIIKEKPSADTLITLLKDITFESVTEKGLRIDTNLCIDGVARPYCLYIPSNYDHHKKNPLLTYLHGGVSQKDLSKDYEENMMNLPFIKMAEEQGYIVLFPLGQYGATWWDSVGISNVLQQLRNTKQHFNIDDNRVFMTGFSDGGSGSFVFAMCYPSDFAGFLPLNGHPGVGSMVGEIQTYFVNLFNRPLYVVNTDEDNLYPAEEILPIIELGLTAGARLFYRIYTGIGHDFAYADEEMPLMEKFMHGHPRALSSTIKWETAYPGHGCMWLTIDSIIDKGHADWYADHNMELTDDRVMFGFYPDEDYEGIDSTLLNQDVLLDYFPDGEYAGPGVRIDKIVGDSTLCALTGMQEGDVIIKLGDIPVNTLEQVNKYKEGKKCGDSAEIVVLRDGQIIEFNSRFPGPHKYNLFTRGKSSARIEGYYSGNKFSFRTSQVGAFSIYIHPDMVQLDQNVVVEVNGKELFNKRVSASPEFILRNFLDNRDRELLYVKRLFFKL